MSRVTQLLEGIIAFALLMGIAAAAPAPSAGRIVIVGDHPLRLHIQTNVSIAPEVQLVPNPERLVIDLPNTAGGPGFHGFRVGNGEIRGVRTSLFSTSPLITRVVVDLKAPQWYQVAPDSTGLLITLGNESPSSDASGHPATDTIGWVSTTAHSRSIRLQPRAVAVKAPVKAPPASVNGVMLRFAEGQMSIHASNASLSEVLYQIQKVTGAEIAIPSGTEQERVAGDFGPGTPNEVLAQLLNGSQLNFVVIGSDVDPQGLRSVILSRKGADADPPAPLAQTAAPEADNTQTFTPPPDNTPEPGEAAVPLPQQQEPLPANGPPPEPPQD